MSVYVAILVVGVALLSLAVGHGLRAQPADSIVSGAEAGGAAVSSPALASISQALGRDDRTMHASSGPAGLELANPARGVDARFSPHGASLRVGGLGFEMGLRAVGQGVRLHPVGATAPRADANRVTYRHGGGVSEWYVNGPAGLEHGFTLARRPGPAVDGPLTLALSLDGVRAEIGESWRSATLIGSGGETVGTYGELWVRDAEGRAMPAWLEPAVGSLLIRVDDAGASYPLTIDPFIQAGNLTASEGSAEDFLGRSVAVSGDTVVVGAPQRTEGGNKAQGAVYVFQRPGGGWGGTGLTQAAKLLASDGAKNDRLGISVAIEGDVVVAGASGKKVGTNSLQGAVYVFEKPGGGWTGTVNESAKLVASDGAASDSLGTAVDVDGDTVIAGAPFHSVGEGSFQGQAYVFEKPGGGWTGTVNEVAKLHASDGAEQDAFGGAVAIDGGTAVVGAYDREIEGHANRGALYVFAEPGGGWAGDLTETAILTSSEGGSGEQLGFAVDVAGGTVVAGAPGHDVGASSGQGAVYVYVEPAGGWTAATETATLTASDGVEHQSLGIAVATSGETVVAGAPGPSKLTAGAAYVFQRPGGGWTSSTEAGKIVPAGAEVGSRFGYGVALRPGLIVAGAPNDQIGGEQQGAAYSFLPPVTSLAVSPPAPNGKAGWYVTAVQATVGATAPPGEGAGETRCVLDPAAPPASFAEMPSGCAYLGAGAQVPAEGQHTLYAASSVAGGAAEAPQKGSFQIDTTPPSISCPPPPTFALGAAGASLAGTVSDSVSGPAEPVASATVGTGTAGQQTVTLHASDVAGNEATVQCGYLVEGPKSGTQEPPKPGQCAGAACELKLEATKVNRKGAARLSVEVPAAGTLTLKKTKAVKGQVRKVTAPGVVQLTVKLHGKAKKRFHRKGRVRVRAIVTFQPQSGPPQQLVKKLTLKKKGHK